MRVAFLSHPLLHVTHWVELHDFETLPLSTRNWCDENRYHSTKLPSPVKRLCNSITWWPSDLSVEDPTTLMHLVPTSVYSFRWTISAIHLPHLTVILLAHPNCPPTHAVYVPRPFCWLRKEITHFAWLTTVEPPTTIFNIKHGQRRKHHSTTL